MTQRFKLAWITGASSGIGAALARRLAYEEIPLFLCGRNGERLKAVADELGHLVPVQTQVADLESKAGLEVLRDALRRTQPDLVVNNAGFGCYGDAVDQAVDRLHAMLDVNVHALTDLSLEAARVLKEGGRQGVILNVSSVAAFLPFPSSNVYAASKAYVSAFTEALDMELSASGIRALTACPGVVTTRFSPRAAGQGEKVDRAHKFSMTAEFAAAEIWRQIQQGKAVHVFDWRYRTMILFVRYVLPKRWVGRFLRLWMEKRLGEEQMSGKQND
jgi:short-subunit dehydrogenase